MFQVGFIIAQKAQISHRILLNALRNFTQWTEYFYSMH